MCYVQFQKYVLTSYYSPVPKYEIRYCEFHNGFNDIYICVCMRVCMCIASMGQVV